MKLSHYYLVLFWVTCWARWGSAATVDGDNLGGGLTIYAPVAKPKGLVLLLSDSQGWDTRMARAAESVTKLDYLVAGISTPAYLQALDGVTTACADTAKPLLDFAAKIAAQRGIPASKAPVLLGFGQGATLAYTALAQSSPTAFHAGFSVNFCPRLALTQPLCAGRSLRSAIDGPGTTLLPSPDQGNGWFVFQADGYCEPQARAFVGAVGHAKWIDAGPADLDPGGTGQSQLIALLQWLDPGIVGQVRTESSLGDLPLREIPATAGQDDRLAVMLSGDGGWAALDQGLAAQLVGRGIPVVGWDSLSYYWTAKTPERAAADLARILRHYLEAWHKSRIVLIGFSFGADVLPFLANRLPPDLRAKLDQVVFLGLSHQATFEFHLSDWLGTGGSGQATLPEAARLQGIRRLCLYGADESDSACPGLASQGARVFKVPGGHHFDDDYPLLADKILEPGS